LSILTWSTIQRSIKIQPIFAFWCRYKMGFALVMRPLEIRLGKTAKCRSV